MVRLEKLLKNSPERLYPVKKYTSLQQNGLMKPELLVAKALEKANQNERILKTDRVEEGRRSTQRNSKQRQNNVKKGAKGSRRNSSKRSSKSPLKT